MSLLRSTSPIRSPIASLGRIPDPGALASRLAAIPGVVEHGLFVGLVRIAIIAGPSGVRILEA